MNTNEKNTSLDLDEEIERRLSDFDKNKAEESTTDSPEKEKTKTAEEEKSEAPEKKPFIQDLGDIFADNFAFAWSSFKAGFNSLFLGGKTLLAHKILILLFISIPAIFGGTVVFIVGLVLILLWILFMILKNFSDILEKIEKKLKSKLVSWRNFIRSDKKMTLSEKIIKFGAYTVVIGANGVMYVIIRGVRVPIKSLAQITKIVGNITDKFSETLNSIMKSPARQHQKFLQQKEPKIGINQSLRAQKKALSAEKKREVFKEKERVRAKVQSQEKQVEKKKEMTKLREKTAIQQAEKARGEQIFKNKVRNEEEELEKLKELERAKKLAKAKESERMKAEELKKIKEKGAKSKDISQQEQQARQAEKSRGVYKPTRSKGPDILGKALNDLGRNIDLNPLGIGRGGLRKIVGKGVEEVGEAIQEGSKLIPKGGLRKGVRRAERDIDIAGERIKGKTLEENVKQKIKKIPSLKKEKGMQKAY